MAVQATMGAWVQADVTDEWPPTAISSGSHNTTPLEHNAEDVPQAQRNREANSAVGCGEPRESHVVHQDETVSNDFHDDPFGNTDQGKQALPLHQARAIRVVVSDDAAQPDPRHPCLESIDELGSSDEDRSDERHQ